MDQNVIIFFTENCDFDKATKKHKLSLSGISCASSRHSVAVAPGIRTISFLPAAADCLITQSLDVEIATGRGSEGTVGWLQSADSEQSLMLS